MTTRDPDEYSQQEIDARREAGLKKLLATPHKPHAAKGKSRVSKAKTPTPNKS